MNQESTANTLEGYQFDPSDLEPPTNHGFLYWMSITRSKLLVATVFLTALFIWDLTAFAVFFVLETASWYTAFKKFKVTESKVNALKIGIFKVKVLEFKSFRY